MSASVRDWLEAQLTPLVPGTWKFIPNQRVPEKLTGITVILKHSSMERMQEAPIGSIRHTVTLTIADPHTDQVAAENALDDSVLELVTALDATPSISWTEAQKVLVTDTYLGWDITLTVISSKET